MLAAAWNRQKSAADENTRAIMNTQCKTQNITISQNNRSRWHMSQPPAIPWEVYEMRSGSSPHHRDAPSWWWCSCRWWANRWGAHRVLTNDHHGVSLLIRQQDLVAWVEPMHLMDAVVYCCVDDVAAEQQRVGHLHCETGGSHDYTCFLKPHDCCVTSKSHEWSKAILKSLTQQTLKSTHMRTDYEKRVTFI